MSSQAPSVDRIEASSRWDAVHDTRIAFLACLDALSFPGRPIPLQPRPGLSARPALDRAAGVLLALLDPGFGLATAGDEETAGVAAAVRERTGAHWSPVARAHFVLVGPGADDPVAARARTGSAAVPEGGTTVLYAGAVAPVRVLLDGPGLAGPTIAELAVPCSELTGREMACAHPPAGVDLLVFGDGAVAGLPRGVTVRPMVGG